MEMTRRIVIVGLGSIGRRHGRLLNERSDLSVESVEPNSESLALATKEVGDLPSHTSLHEALKTRPDMVLIATPHSMHAEQAISALQAGSHVFCEKPMSDNLADAIRMKEAAERSDKLLNIGFNLHFHPGLVLLKETIDSGVLGTVLHAHVRIGSYITLVNSLSRYQAVQQGALLLDYAHQPDILYWLLGKKPTALYACAFQAGDLELSSNPNVVVINCEYDGRLISSIHMNYAQMPQRHEYEIVGDKAWAVLDVEVGNMRVGKREDATTETKTFSTDRDDMYRAEHRAFLETVKGERHPETSAKDGLVSMAVCEAAMKSWKAHEPVKIQL